MVARDAYFWAWPMVNIYNRRLAFDQCPEPGLMNGVLPFAPLNTLSMLHDYVEPEQRWVACPNQAETKYLYQDLDESGAHLNSRDRYTVTFAKGQLPPVKGFWSLTLYDEYHFLVPNEIKRYSLGTKNKDLETNADGSLTIYVQANAPGGDKNANWLPAQTFRYSCVHIGRITGFSMVHGHRRPW